MYLFQSKRQCKCAQGARHPQTLTSLPQWPEMTFLQRHRLINDVVKTKLDGNFVHALSIEAKTPTQWNEAYKVEQSPNCRGGFGK